jgi:D-sedoheptulose 7-phosphate isomerase
MEHMIKNQLEESANLKIMIAKSNTNEIMKIADSIYKSLSNGGVLYLCGNGGSAADAQHISTELVHRFQIDRRKCIPSVALTTNTSTITAIGNDWGYDEIYSRQVEGFVKKNDVLIGISTSGNSKNIILAIEQAKKNGAITIGFSGCGGKLKEICDFCFCVPSKVTARVQEVHITVFHIICDIIEQKMCR